MIDVLLKIMCLIIERNNELDKRLSSLEKKYEKEKKRN